MSCMCRTGLVTEPHISHRLEQALATCQVVENCVLASLAVFEQGPPASFCMYCSLLQASFFTHMYPSATGQVAFASHYARCWTVNPTVHR